MASNTWTPPRKYTHRKRVSALRLSSDTTSSLPEYIPNSAWSQNHFQQQQRVGSNLKEGNRRFERVTVGVEGNERHVEEEDDIPSDKPPDYPDSAEEADEDTDDSDSPQPHPRYHEYQNVYSPVLASETYSRRPRTASPRRSKKFLPQQTHKRGKSSQSQFQHSLHKREGIGNRGQHPFAHDDLDITPSPPTSSDPYLDSLLERSVHALEMSNTLLQSSISTQASLGAIFSGGDTSPRESTLHAHAMNLSSRIQDSWNVKATWADDLEEITKGVEGLLSSGEQANSSIAGGEDTETEMLRAKSISMRRKSLRSHSREGSYSLPDTSPLASMKRNQRRSSFDVKDDSETLTVSTILSAAATPRLNLAPMYRANLVSPPPRPITQFIPDHQDEDTFTLPSTIGVRSQPSMLLSPDWKSAFSDTSSAPSTPSLLLATSSLPAATTSTTSLLLPPKLTDKPLEPTTPAYNMLSSFVSRPQGMSTATGSGSNTPSTSFTTSFMSNLNLRRSSSSRSASASTDRSTSTVAAGKRRASSPTRSPQHTQERPSRAPHRGMPPLDWHRPMTPPAEESSSSSDGCVAKLTVQSLKKILDDQPPPVQSNDTSRSSSISGLRSGLMAPKFMPRTPVKLPEAGTSTATASISRLFTKGTHSSSTRAPSPPRQSAMKHSRNNSAATIHIIGGSAVNSSAPPTPSSTSQTLIVPPTLNGSSTPSPSSTTLSIPGMVSKVIGRTSPASSGRSTPSKRISFAELPESYASTRDAGGSGSKFRDKHGKKRRKHSARSGRYSTDGELDASPPRWWGLGGLGLGLARQEERMEDRMTRNWTGRIGGTGMGGLDDWAI